ncbi:DUF5707 domain-containing protein [Streptomyces mangrovisoli]|uniref:Tat pathway signal sequence domain protein n=1 Tax=Streptomyces mangrovisoli TaxID=1428628 RepID=A0A1J4NRN1_9ACTN|nr:DUF5707 domain-containing protein [Streptomyces mangrovisoli]OIJ64252.1 hypothetical protein WN71_029225 [Streptomyces mangrovisoli]
MSRRTAVALAAGVVALGGASAFAFAHGGDQSPALAHTTARYTAPDGDRAGSLTFATDATASSGVKKVNVLPWPKSSSFAKMGLTAKDMADADQAVCKPAGGHTVHCTFSVKVTAADAASSPHGAWHMAVLVTAKDGTTTLDTKAADFSVR